MDTRVKNLIQKLQRGDEHFQKHLEAGLELCNTKERRVSFLRGNIFGVLASPSLQFLFKDHRTLISSIYAKLTEESDWGVHIAFEKEVLSLGLNTVFHLVRPKIDQHNVYGDISNPSCEFFHYTYDDFLFLKLNLEILMNLGDCDETILTEIASFNIIPKLIFIVEKIHTGIPNESFLELAKLIKSAAIKLMNMCFTLEDVINRTCRDLELLAWFFRTLHTNIISSQEYGLAEALSLLSASIEFVPALQDYHIIRDWVYGILCMVLLPERRTREWYEANPSLKNEEETVYVLYFLLRTLVNTSKTHGGVQEVIYSIMHHGVDVLWRAFYSVLRFEKLHNHLLSVCLNLANNLLRFPGYRPPVHSSM